MDRGDDQAAVLNPGNKPLTQITEDDSFREFEFRQYLFACQAKLLFKLNRPFEVASRGYSFIIGFSKALALHESMLPFCMREVWVITACLALINTIASHYSDGQVAPDIETEFFHLQGDLYSLCQIKFMRLAYLIGYGLDIERSPVNSASLSMLPWPDVSSEVFEKEKVR
ncbi:trafficking protein particle complex II-specific subunit 130 homolog [Camellia sinensis]|uniref:trafficking protein particle complex II-specific subunit 130 homolog n=1 Tax=Camellia sinensis TaxID=4442 RepID=UPI001035E927|nr:trafficking protein particle complex II-specific subunit 130 homolog [Camellia sinensis]